jgi:hypothetical protein
MPNPSPGSASAEERVRCIEHRGKSILLVDLTNRQSPEIITLLAEVQDQIAQKPENSVLVLADFTGAQVDRTVSTRIKEVLVFDKPFVKKSAWVGTDNLPKVFYENFKTFSQRDLPVFANRNEAMDWLIQD